MSWYILMRHLKPAISKFPKCLKAIVCTLFMLLRIPPLSLELTNIWKHFSQIYYRNLLTLKVILCNKLKRWLKLAKISVSWFYSQLRIEIQLTKERKPRFTILTTSKRYDTTIFEQVVFVLLNHQICNTFLYEIN